MMPTKLWQRLFDLRTIGQGNAVGDCDRSLGIVRVAARSECEFGFVGFGHHLHELGQARRMSEAEDEHAGRKRIERARVTDLHVTRKTTLDAIDGVARGDANRLIDHQDSIH